MRLYIFKIKSKPFMLNIITKTIKGKRAIRTIFTSSNNHNIFFRKNRRYRQRYCSILWTENKLNSYYTQYHAKQLYRINNIINNYTIPQIKYKNNFFANDYSKIIVPNGFLRRIVTGNIFIKTIPIAINKLKEEYSDIYSNKPLSQHRTNYLPHYSV